MYIGILSRGAELYSTQSLLAAGERKGHQMSIYNYMHCNLVAEKGHIDIYYTEHKIQAVDAIIPRIGASLTSTGVALIQQFEAMGVRTSATASALLNARNKYRCLQQLALAGIDIPKTMLVNAFTDIEKVIEKVGGLPVIIKVLEGTHGAGVLLGESYQSVAAILGTLYKLRQRVLVQEFIEESEGVDIRAFVVGEEVVAAMKRQAQSGEFRSNLHLGASAIPIVLTKKEEQVALKAVKAMGLGVAGVDMLRSKRGPLIIEINASPGLEGIETTTGIDIAGKIIDYVVQLKKIVS